MLREKVKPALAALFIAVIFLSCAPPPPDALSICEEAYQIYWGNDWDKVIQLSTRAIEVSPDFPWAYSLRGVAMTNKGRYGQAIADFDKAIELDPEFLAAYTNRAKTYIKVGEFENSRNDLAKVLDVTPFDVISLVAMSEVQSIMKNVDESCKYMMDAIGNGFGDLELLEQNRNFDNLVFSACYEEILAERAALSAPPGKAPPPGGSAVYK